MITTKCQSWDFVIENYESLIRHEWRIEPMLELIRHIVFNYSSRLYAFTSLDKLIISIYENIDMLSEALHVRYDCESKKFSFAYFGGHSALPQPEWQREYDAEDGIKKFDAFIKMINW